MENGNQERENDVDKGWFRMMNGLGVNDWGVLIQSQGSVGKSEWK